MHKLNFIWQGIAAFAVLIAVFSSWYTINETERGVILRNGAVVGLAEPGLHLKIPLIDVVETISVQTHVVHWSGQGVGGEFPPMATYSRDQQPAAIAVSVNYRITDPMLLYAEYQTLENMVARLIVPRTNEQVRNVFGQFNAVAAVQERARLDAQIEMAVTNAVTGPVIIESVQVENIDFSEAYEQSIEQRMLAEVEVQRIQQNAERERVQAEIVVIQATAEADAIRARGQAEADAINARGEALGNNPELVSLIAAEKWNGVLPTTMLPGSTVPFVAVPNR